MAQIFHPSFNTISRVSVFGAIFFLAAGAWAWDRLLRSSYTTQVNVARGQPVPFSHKHHVAGLGIDCRYCHTTVEQGAFAGMPPTKTCMGCHSLVWQDAPMLAPVRKSYQEDRPIEWTRVHDLPDFAYFDHSIHIDRGIGCSTCHGRVDQMPLMWRTETLNMDWCLDCHRDPVANVRPKDRIYDMEFEPDSLPRSVREELAHEYGINKLMANGINVLTNCSVCHR